MLTIPGCSMGGRWDEAVSTCLKTTRKGHQEGSLTISNVLSLPFAPVSSHSLYHISSELEGDEHLERVIHSCYFWHPHWGGLNAFLEQSMSLYLFLSSWCKHWASWNAANDSSACNVVYNLAYTISNSGPNFHIPKIRICILGCFRECTTLL